MRHLLDTVDQNGWLRLATFFALAATFLQVVS